MATPPHKTSSVAAKPSPAIHSTRWGTTGPPVLMIHGGIQGSRISGTDHFAKQRELAERGWLVTVPDRPGHGQSATRGPEDIEREAVWAADMLDEQGSHLVGHSYGACVALAAAALRPDAVMSVTLIEGPLFTLVADIPQVQERRAAHERIRSADLSPLARLIEFSRLLGMRKGLLAGTPTRDELARMGEGLAEMRSPFEWDGAGRAAAAVHGAGIPVLAVTGGWSPAAESAAEAIVQLTEGRRLVMDVESHFPHLVSERFNNHLHDFLSSAEARAGISRPAAVAADRSPR